jgi:hypothetical protein
VETYLIYSHEHLAWWVQNGYGYTQDVEEAGRYTQTEAIKIVEQAKLGWHPTETGGDMLPHMVMVREDSYSLITAVAIETVLMIERGW